MTKGADLATKFEATNEDFINRIQGLTDQQWAKECEETGWSVGVTAHHLAESHATLGQLIAGVASGNSVPPITPDMLNTINAEHAQRAANVTRNETLQLARTSGAQAAQILRGLTDEQLQRTLEMPGPSGPASMTAESITENILIGHMGMHLPMIDRAIS